MKKSNLFLDILLVVLFLANAALAAYVVGVMVSRDDERVEAEREVQQEESNKSEDETTEQCMDYGSEYTGWTEYSNSIHGYTLVYPPGYVHDDPDPDVPNIGLEKFDKDNATNFNLGHTNGKGYFPPDGVGVEEWITGPDAHVFFPDEYVAETGLTIAGEDAVRTERRERAPGPTDTYYFVHEGQLFRVEILNPQLAGENIDLFFEGFQFCIES